VSKLIVVLEGGLVNEAHLLKSDLFPGDIVNGVIVVDWDVEGADGDETTEARDKDGGLIEALIHEEDISSLPKDCNLRLVALAYLEPNLVNDTVDKDLPLLVSKLHSEAGQAALAERLKGGGS
jgi:hypothetical protein